MSIRNSDINQDLPILVRDHAVQIVVSLVTLVISLSIYKGTRWSAYVMPDPRVHIGPNTFLKYHAIQDYIVFGPISHGEESL